jgi:Glycosyl hydrolase family 99
VFTRRQFLASVAAPVALGPLALRDRVRGGAPIAGLAIPRTRDGYPAIPDFDASAVGRQLRQRFPNLRNHFIFEYYPWYGTNPWRHWNQWDRRPPDDIAATCVPALGPYDSRDTRVLERHAQWIVESGAGAIDVSWWGRGSYEDQVVPRLMDVMRDHGLKVAFHLEPYHNGRTDTFAADVRYLLTEYGDKRHWDCMLVLENAHGKQGPIFKAFATIMGPFGTDCQGRIFPAPLWRPDPVWHQQTDTVRETLRRDFDHVWLLSDSSEIDRVRAAGFDAVAPYGAFNPEKWPAVAQAASAANLLVSFSIGTGFDSIAQRNVPADSCYRPPEFVPPADLDWTKPADREKARRLALWQAEASMRAAVGLQANPSLLNAREGFFAVYIATFNEWHEGTAFEPMKDSAALLPEELPYGYHNPAYGRYRFDYLKRRLARIIAG